MSTIPALVVISAKYLASNLVPILFFEAFGKPEGRIFNTRPKWEQRARRSRGFFWRGRSERVRPFHVTSLFGRREERRRDRGDFRGIRARNRTNSRAIREGQAVSCYISVWTS